MNGIVWRKSLPRLRPLAFGFLVLLFIGGLACRRAWGQSAEAEVQRLRAEVATKGWLLYAAKSEAGDYDLFLCRPDGSARVNVTRTADAHEFGGRFSPDGKKMLYRRVSKAAGAAKGEIINHDLWGAAGALVLADANGGQPQVLGREGEWPWASWGPDGTQLACLYKREGRIRIVDIQTKRVIRELPRQGIFQQMFWSNDGKRLCGTANLNGQDWNILSLDLETGKTTQISRSLCCTPDWFQADSGKIIYSCRIPGLATDYGWTMLMQGSIDGKTRSLLYGERGRHIYYGCASPDDSYAVFSVPESDGGIDSEMVVMRLSDAPIIVPADYKELKALHPNAKSGPVLRLGLPAFEPHWTFAEVGSK